MTPDKQNSLVSFNSSLSKKRKIFLITIVLISGVAIFLMLSGIMEDTGDNRTEQNYITKTYVVQNIMERQIIDQGRVNYHYLFIEPQGENFNLSLPIIRNKNDNYGELIAIGDTVDAKVYNSELEEMQSGSILKMFKRFLKNDNREVEVFKLTIRDKVIFDKDITWSDVNFRKGGDLSVNSIFVLLIGLVIVASIVGSIRRKVDSRKK